MMPIHATTQSVVSPSARAKHCSCFGFASVCFQGGGFAVLGLWKAGMNNPTEKLTVQKVPPHRKLN